MPTTYNAGAPSVNPTGATTHHVCVYSGFFECRRTSGQSAAAPCSRGDRAGIASFSASARRNFLKKIFSLSALPSFFSTLTYPAYYPADANTWKRHLDRFSRVLLRRFPHAWFFWKLEPQRRGAPHFHLMGDLACGAVSVALLRCFVAATWFRVVGSGDGRHAVAGTQFDFIHDATGKVRAYVCKYVGKPAGSDLPEWARPGRFWGIVGRKNLPAAPCVHLLLPKDIYFRLRRVVRKWLARLASPASAGYAVRLKKMPSFFVLAPHELLFRFLESAAGFTVRAPGPLLPDVLELELIPF